MKIHRSIIASLCTIITGSLLNAQDEVMTELPVTFDDPSVTYSFRDFGPEGEHTTVVADPDDANNMVAQTIRPADAETWSGVVFMSGSRIPLTMTDTKLSARVRAPAANIPILLKAENKDSGDPPAIYLETIARTTKADEWETLTWDFSEYTGIGAGAEYSPIVDGLVFLNQLAIFFNFNASNVGPQTYYFDDVVFGAPEVLNLPFDFESDTLEYSFGEGGGFDGGVSTIIDNPQMNDANPSAKVGQMVKNAGQPWAGSTLTTEGPINFGLNTRIAMDVFSPRAGVTVKMKLEPSSGEAEVDVDTTVANEWETLIFDFAGKLTKEFKDLSLFFDFGTMGDGSANFTFLFDNIQLAPEQITIPLDFENDNLLYLFNNFDGGVLSREANPEPSGINTSGFVGKMVKHAGQPWGGALVTIPGGLDFSESSIFNMKVWSPRVDAAVLLKLEPSGDPPIEVTVNTTVANEWEELTFDFTGMTGPDFTGLTFIFDNGTDGDGSDDFTFYIDDVELEGVGDELDPVALPVTFEEDDVDYTFVAFGGMGETVIADDPVMGVSNKVAHAIRTDAAETWAGTTIGGDRGLANPIPFSNTATQLSMRVYSPAAGIPIRMKVEDKANPAISVETEATTTMANAWETLVFDFGEPAEGTATLSLDNTYDKLSVFFNFGTTGAVAGEQTFYYDDIEFTGMTGGGIGGPMKIDLPITFSGSADEIDYSLTDFGGAVTILGADPFDSGNVVAATQKGPGAETWAGTTMSTPSGLMSPIPFSEDFTKISVRILSPAAGIPVLLKVEELGRTDNVGLEVFRDTTVADAWETLEFDFSESVQGPNSTPLDLNATYQKISIFFNFGVTGDDGGELIFYWDDVIFLGIQKIDLPISFDEELVDYTLTDFGGAATALGADPTDGSNMVAITQKGGGDQTWAGTTISTPDGLKNPISFSETNTKISVRVLSPAADIPILLKVEDSNDATISSEVQVSSTMANAWETLVFDFANGNPTLNLANTYDKISIFFNFGVTGDDGGELIFHWDDVTFIAGPAQGNLVNISTRAVVGTVDEVMIGGFIIEGGARQVLIQALGPELANKGISNALADTVLTVIQTAEGDGAARTPIDPPIELMVNDNWEDSQGQMVSDLWGGSPPLTAGSLSSAVVLTLDPGGYTANVEGKDGTTGVASVEVYRIDSPGADGQLVNISTRALVETGDEVMIGGFIIEEGDQEVLIQALGPELANKGISNALADTVLTVIQTAEGDGAARTPIDPPIELMVNDNWEDSQGQMVSDLWGGSPPLTAGSLSSAVVLTLGPGGYTAKVEGKDGTTGVASVEVYRIDNN